MTKKEFENQLEAARSRPMLPEALRQLGVTLKLVGHGRNGSRRWQTTTRHGRAGDLSSVAFFQNPDGTWLAYDNKARSGRQTHDAISVLTDLFDVPFKDAVHMLAGSPTLSEAYSTRTVSQDAPIQESTPIEFSPPKKADTNRHAAAYLSQTRCIPNHVVGRLIGQGEIYETLYKPKNSEKGYTMVVFPARDTDGSIVGIERCSTYSGIRFKGIVRGSDSRCGWYTVHHVDPTRQKADLFFCESAIDAISLMCLHGKPGVYISMSGVKDCVFESMTKRFHGTPVICTDNDYTGNNFRSKYPQCRTLTPEIGKDWNDELKFRVAHGLDFALKDVPPAAIKGVSV